MRYFDESLVRLGDTVAVPVPSGTAEARVVMLGDTYEHLAIDASFVRWVKAERRLEAGSIVVQWIDENPLKHDDPARAQVGDLLFSPLDQFVVLLRRAD